jgi:hypothetical protein
MHRDFEEVGVSVGGIAYGHFTGEVQFDETGQAVIIDIEASGFNSNALRLDIEDLVRQRIALRRKLGITFLEDGGEESAGTLLSGLCSKAFQIASKRSSKRILKNIWPILLREVPTGMPLRADNDGSAMTDQNRRVALFQPWGQVDPADRLNALEMAAEIIFRDKSAVVRQGDGWRPDYRRMRNFAGEPEADRFILELDKAAAFAALAHARFF